MNKSKITVPCKVFAGLFPSERFVLVKDSSAYVHADLVEISGRLSDSDPTPGKVQASLVKQEEGMSLIELSGEPVAGGLRMWIPSMELQYE